MNNHLFAVVSMLLILVLSPLSLAFASTSSNSERGDNDNFLNIREATIDANSDEMTAFLETHGHIPTNGDGGAFGYGVLTTEGLDAVVVSTTHAGVQDSEEQTDANDPIWHNHFVTLGENSDNCGNDLQVESITFESPGQIDIENSNADLTEIPASFSGTDALSKNDLTIRPGTDVDDVVSFRLSPQFNENDELEAVCVTDIKSVDNIAFDNNNNSNGNDESAATQGIGQSQSTTQ